VRGRENWGGERGSTSASEKKGLGGEEGVENLKGVKKKKRNRFEKGESSGTSAKKDNQQGGLASP